MSDFFSLGGGGSRERSRGGASRNNNNNQEEQQRNNRLNQSTETWNLYNRSSINPHHDHYYNIPPDRIPFELWNQHQNAMLLQPAVGTGGGVGSSGVMSANEERSGDFLMMSSSSSAGGSGIINCEDCGNQAKKDCTHRRCRTCCTSRGFECQTHVKSTWVSASKRRQRQQQQQQEPQLQQHTDIPKRPRQNHPNSSVSGFGNFPAEVRSPAVFNCVRVSSIDDLGEDQFAYQTAVSIGGHVFKGILYDQGPESTTHHH